MTKRVFAGGDLHCGSQVGLAPPGWWYALDGPKKNIARQQRETWKFYQDMVENLKPFDVAIWNGDLIDGNGKRSGGTELICTDRLEQVAIAEYAMRLVDAPVNVIIAGTPYHSGTEEDYESVLAEKFSTTLHGHAFIDIDGWTFDVKHKVGSSTVPYGRHTAVAKERLWNLLWADVEGAPRADIFLRSHVHHHNYCGGPDWLAMTLPALQGMGSKYGERQCSGIVDFGFVTFDVTPEEYQWKSHLLKIRSAFPGVVKC